MLASFSFTDENIFYSGQAETNYRMTDYTHIHQLTTKTSRKNAGALTVQSLMASVAFGELQNGSLKR